jgi:hypothetical protein
MNLTWVPYKYTTEGFWSFGIQEMHLGTSSIILSKAKVDAILTNI